MSLKLCHKESCQFRRAKQESSPLLQEVSQVRKWSHTSFVWLMNMYADTYSCGGCQVVQKG